MIHKRYNPHYQTGYYSYYRYYQFQHTIPIILRYLFSMILLFRPIILDFSL